MAPAGEWERNVRGGLDARVSLCCDPAGRVAGGRNSNQAQIAYPGIDELTLRRVLTYCLSLPMQRYKSSEVEIELSSKALFGPAERISTSLCEK